MISVVHEDTGEVNDDRLCLFKELFVGSRSDIKWLKFKVLTNHFYLFIFLGRLELNLDY